MNLFYMDRVAKRKTNSPKEWEAFKWERIGDDFIITGGIPKLLKSGKNKGNKTWKGSDETRSIISFDELEKEMIIYEKETGLCSDCRGKNVIFKSWDREKGTEYKPCQKCNATGKSILK